MAKMLKTVGMVVAAVALVATAVATFGASLGIAASTIAAASTVATVAGLASTAIGIASALLTKPPNFGAGGNPQRFVTNPQSGIPYAIGRTRVSGLQIHGDTSDGFSGKTKNDVLSFAVLLSGGGQIEGIESFTADKEAVTFDAGGNAIGRLRNYMAQKIWLGGAMSSALALSLGSASVPGWTSAHKLSGMTHALWMLRFETDGSKYGAGRPEPAWVGKWVKIYDPRLDSTYPGGSGSCRALDESTYVWSRNPALHALTWCLGRWQNGKRVLGIGAPIATIRIAEFVQAANIADANGWRAGGVTYSTESKWNTLKAMLQAGGAVPTKTAAMIGCRVFAPRVSLVTIPAADLLDGLTIPAAKSRRDRVNSIIPRFRSEDHEWNVISGSPITVASYVTADGGLRSRELDLPFVQHEVGQAGVDGLAQAGALARYEIENAREAGPISFTTGPKYIGLKDGDCVTLNVPEEGLSNQKVILIGDPKFDPATGKISFTAETERDAKHGFALGQTTTPPPPFSLTPPALQPVQPAAGAWTLAAVTGADGLPMLRVSGAVSDRGWDNVLIQYRKVGATSWTLAGSYPDNGDVKVDIPAVDGATAYEARVAYVNAVGPGDWRDLSSVTTATNNLSNNSVPLGFNAHPNSEVVDGSTVGYVSNIFTDETGATVDFGVNFDSGSGSLYGNDGRNELYTHMYKASNLTPGKYLLGWQTSGFGGNVTNLGRYALPVTPGDRVYASIQVAGHNFANMFIRIRWHDKTGAMISESDATVAGFVDAWLGGKTGSPSSNTYNGEIFATAPANAAWATIAPYGYIRIAAVDAWIFQNHHFITKVPAGQTVAPPYTPGPVRRDADKTDENTANNTANVGAKTTAQLLLDVDSATLAASNAAIDAADAQIRIQNIVADNVLDRSEKPDTILRWNALANEATGIDAQAAAYGITTERTNYNNARADLASYLSSLSPPWYDASTNSSIVRATFIAKFDAAYSTRQTLLNKIAEIAGQKATWAGVSGGPSSSPSNIDSATGKANNGLDSAGNVLTNKVSTGSILPNSVILPGYSGLASDYDVTAYNSWVDVLSSTATTVGAPVDIGASFLAVGLGNAPGPFAAAGFQVRLVVDGTILRHWIMYVNLIDFSSSPIDYSFYGFERSYSTLHTPSAASHTWKLQAYLENAGNVWSDYSAKLRFITGSNIKPFELRR